MRNEMVATRPSRQIGATSPCSFCPMDVWNACRRPHLFIVVHRQAFPTRVERVVVNTSANSAR